MRADQHGDWCAGEDVQRQTRTGLGNVAGDAKTKKYGFDLRTKEVALPSEVNVV